MADVPEEVDEIIQRGIFVPEDMQAAEGTMYEAMLNGRCAVCFGELGEDTTILVNRLGTLFTYCGGACATDHMVMGFLQEQYDDHIQAIKFRGQGGADG